MKTNDEIKAEIKRLEEMKPTVRNYSAFGDDNHDAIDAQIATLDGEYDEDDIYDIYGDEDSDEFAQNVLDAALQARNWMHDIGGEEAPSKEWEPLVKPTPN